MTLPHDSWADRYEAVMQLTFGPLYDVLTSTAMEEIRQRVPAPAAVVDFGAGCGRLAIPLAAEGYRVTAVEPSVAMLEELRRNAQGYPIDFIHSRMEDYRTDRPHDFALCVFTVLAYVLDTEALTAGFEAVAAALAPGGLFLVDVPDESVFQSFDHDSADIIRGVRIEPIADSLYEYDEHTTLRTELGQVSYSDRFALRHWTKDEILAALADAGFTTADDVTRRFAGLGAEYLLMRRKG